jgi:hypothetical protein
MTQKESAEKAVRDIRRKTSRKLFEGGSAVSGDRGVRMAWGDRSVGIGGDSRLFRCSTQRRFLAGWCLLQKFTFCALISGKLIVHREP